MDEEIILTTGDEENPVEVKHIHHYEKEKEMSASGEVTNYFNPTPVASVVGGAGYGGGDMGGLLALALLGGGLNGRRGEDGNCGAAETALMNAGFDGINHNVNTSLIGLTNQLTQGFTNQNSLDVMAKLGSIEAAIPLSGAQTQLAVAGATGEIRTHLGQVENGILAGQISINKNISDAIASSLASQNNINVNVLQTAAANLTATKDSQFAIVSAITADGTATRTLINQLNTDNLNRLLTVSDLDRRDEANRGRFRESEINITNTNTATAQQAQAQFQQQQQFQVLASLAANVANLANDVQQVRQTQSNVNFGVQGTAGQTATAANTRVN